MRKVKITVLDQDAPTESDKKYVDDGACPFFKQGDVFIYAGDGKRPKGFCAWAWNDIYKVVHSISTGNTRNTERGLGDIQITNCADGARPVTFIVEPWDAD